MKETQHNLLTHLEQYAQAGLHKGSLQNFIMKYEPILWEKKCAVSETSTSWLLGFTDTFVSPETNSEDNWAPMVPPRAQSGICVRETDLASAINKAKLLTGKPKPGSFYGFSLF